MTFKLTKMSYLSHVKDKEVCLRRVWVRLTTAYLLCAWEFRQIMHLRFNFDTCPMHSPFGFMHLTHKNLTTGALFCLNSLAKVNTQLLIYKWTMFCIKSNSFQMTPGWQSSWGFFLINSKIGKRKATKKNVYIGVTGWTKIG